MSSIYGNTSLPRPQSLQRRQTKDTQSTLQSAKKTKSVLANKDLYKIGDAEETAYTIADAHRFSLPRHSPRVLANEDRDEIRDSKEKSTKMTYPGRSRPIRQLPRNKDNVKTKPVFCDEDDKETQLKKQSVKEDVKEGLLIENAELKEEIKKLNNEINILEMDKMSLKHHRGVLNYEVRRLQMEHNSVTKRINKTEAKMCESCDGLSQKLLRTEGELKDVQRRYNIVKTHTQMLGRDVDDMKEQIETERGLSKSLQRQVETLESDKKSELSKVRGELTLLDRRNTSLQDENADLQRRCKSREEALVKMDFDMRQLKTENRQLESDLLTLKQDKDILACKLENERHDKLELQKRRGNTSSPVALDHGTCPSCLEHKNEILEVRRELEDMKERLYGDMNCAQAVIQRDIYEINERIKPDPSNMETVEIEKLAKDMKLVFENSWKEVFCDLKKCNDDITVIDYLLDIVKQSYDFGEDLLLRYTVTLDKVLVEIAKGIKINNAITKSNCEHAKRITNLAAVDVGEMFLSSRGSRYKKKGAVVQTYVKDVFSICWRMLSHEPKLRLHIAPKLSKFDTEWFDKYRQKGGTISYVVWPMVYREDENKICIISKGIAEGK